jgi:hypothetical protein
MSTSTTNLGSRAARAGGSVVRHVRSAVDRSGARPAGGDRSASGWVAVTVLRNPSAIDPAALPGPLAELGEHIEVKVRPAPGDKGTELAARLRDQVQKGSAPQRLSGEDPHAELRSALRRAKQLIEVGEVLAVDPAPHGDRPPTPGGTLLEAWTKAAPKGGVR